MKKILSIVLVLAMLVLPVLANPEEEIRGEGEHEHVFNKTADEECHFEECTVCFERFGVGEHTFENGVCTVCRYKELVNPFVDVKKGAWYHDQIIQAVATGIINGKTATVETFDDGSINVSVKLTALSKEHKHTDSDWKTDS